MHLLKARMETERVRMESLGFFFIDSGEENSYNLEEPMLSTSKEGIRKTSVHEL